MLAFDSKAVNVYSAAQNKCANIPVAEGTIEAMTKETVGRLRVDFPLALFFGKTPNKTFLTGVTSGHVLNTVPIGGAVYDHLSRHRARAVAPPRSGTAQHLFDSGIAAPSCCLPDRPRRSHQRHRDHLGR